ncbi:MAG: zinc-ribbon domain-containing protein [Lachnospiraceae bacterium]|nr:zinc-ribbon domain-containing protein [Lachnospiraceae bacterium]
MFCSNCGRQLKEGAAFCDRCGTPVQAAPIVTQTKALKGQDAEVEKHKKKIVMPVILAVLILAVAGTGMALYIKSDGDQNRNNREQVEEELHQSDKMRETGQSEVPSNSEAQSDTEPQDVFTEEEQGTVSAEPETEVEMISFVDMFGEPYTVEKNPSIAEHSYTLSAFVHEGDKLSYEDEVYVSRLGVDVSHYNGEIEWGRVKEQGFEFAMIRLGYRGYGAEGTIHLDSQYESNIRNAQSAGVETGVYFFSQAVNEAEAFCKKITEAGYTPMIFCNMFWEAYELDLTQLSEYPVWYADYESMPQTPYQFAFWQYSNHGSVDGIEGAVDLNLQLIRKDSASVLW